MDVFVFSSRSETQGMVIAEAMAARLPVVALSANGVREVVRNEQNGFLLPARAPAAEFARRIAVLAGSDDQAARFSREAQKTALEFSRERCAELALDFYREARQLTKPRRLANELNPWESYLERIAVEWKLLATKTQALAAALMSEPQAKAS
jgi:glycogen synthase